MLPAEFLIRADIPKESALFNDHIKYFGRLNDVTDKLRLTVSNLDQTANQWNIGIKATPDVTVTRTAFSSERFAYPLFAARRRLADLLAQGHLLKSKIPNCEWFYPPKLNDQNIFAYPISGVTLLDIENLPLPLSGPDISKIDNLFRGRWSFQPDSIQKGFILHGVTYLMVQSCLDERLKNGVPVPPSIKPLRERLLVYFDHYLDWFMDPQSGTLDNFKKIMAFNRSPHILSVLGSFVPARLGITPASAIKLFLEKGVREWFIKWIWKKRMNDAMMQAKDAYLQGVLPADLERYILYDKIADQGAATALAKYYQRQDQTNVPIDSSGYFNQLEDRLGKQILRDVSASPNRRFEVAFTEGHLVSSMTITAQNREVIIAILRLKDGSTHLTLEIGRRRMGGDRGGRIFGIPVHNLKEGEQTSSYLEQDVFKALWDYLYLEHPQLKPLPPVSRKPVGIELLWEKVSSPVLGRLNRIRVKTAGVNGQQTVEIEQKNREETGVQKFNVVCTREEIIKILGKKTPSEIIDNVEDAVQRLRTGDDSVDFAKMAGYHRWRLKVAGVRLVFEKAESGEYIVCGGGNRGGSAYSRTQRRLWSK